MSFHQRNKKNFARNSLGKNNHLPVFAVFFLILIFSFSWTRNILFTIGSPLWYIKNSTTSFISNSIGVLYSKVELINENNILRQQVAIKTKEQALLDLLKQENEDLKNVLNRSKSNQKLLLSAVLVKPFLSTYDTLIIDVGSSDSVKVGDYVLADGNIYIGYVSEVYDQTSKVVLYSSPGEKVKVLIGENKIEKEAIGLGGGNFRVELPKEIDVKEGDSVVIPSISTNIFGVVEKLESKDSDSFQRVLFKNPTNIDELKWVEVLTSEKK